MASEFGDVSQVVATGLAIAAFGTAAEQYIVQNLMGNRRVILDRQAAEEKNRSDDLTEIRDLCDSTTSLPNAVAEVKKSLDKYDQEKEDLIAIDVQDRLKLYLPQGHRIGLKSGISSTYIYIAAAVIYSMSTYFSGIHLTQMVGLHPLNEFILGSLKFPYTIDAFLNITILTLSLQTIFFSRFMWKSLMLRSKISQHSEQLRSLGESLFAQGEFAKYISENNAHAG